MWLKRGKREWFLLLENCQACHARCFIIGKELCELEALVITVPVTFKATRICVGISLAFECYLSKLLLVKSLMAT